MISDVSGEGRGGALTSCPSRARARVGAVIDSSAASRQHTWARGLRLPRVPATDPRVRVLTVFRRSCSATLILELRARTQSATDGRSAGPSSRLPSVRAPLACACVRAAGRAGSLLSAPLSVRVFAGPAHRRPTSRFLSQTNTPRETDVTTRRRHLPLQHHSIYGSSELKPERTDHLLRSEQQQYP